MAQPGGVTMTLETLHHIAKEWDCELQLTFIHEADGCGSRDLATFYHQDRAIFSLVLLDQATVWPGYRLSAELQLRCKETKP